MLKCEAKEVFQSNKIVEFKQLLDTLYNAKQGIESTLESGDAKIRDHCDKARNVMQLVIEQAHVKLDEIHKGFMDETENHEKECQAKFKSIQHNKDDIEKTLSESNEFLSKSNILLKQFKIEQTEMSPLVESGQLLLVNLEQIKDGIKREMFNESLLKFDRQKSFDSNVIGKIVKQNKELYFLENVEKMRELDFSKTEFTSCFPSLKLFKIKSNSFLFFYLKNNILNLVCLDKDANTLFEKRGLIKNKKIEKFINFSHNFSSHSKIAYIYTEENHFQQEKSFFNYRSFDENFNFLGKTKLENRPYACGVNGEHIFILNQNEKFCTISMYNHSLEIVQNFGQENSMLPFYCPRDLGSFLVNIQYFIIIQEIPYENHNNVTIINRSNGLIESIFKTFEIVHQMRLYLDKFLLSFNRDTCSLGCYPGKKKMHFDFGVLEMHLKNA
jgi:hypothetical protein